ncbi:MAG: hypothetical protein AAB414_05015 [Patescibacteria group bacterium]
MFGLRLATFVKKDKRSRRTFQKDVIAEQVKKVLEAEDQKLILMVRS